MITECSHGMGNPKACWECMQDGPVDAPRVNQPVKGKHGWLAKFEGHCSGGCSDKVIEVGTRIVAMTDGTYRHFLCVDEWESP